MAGGETRSGGDGGKAATAAAFALVTVLGAGIGAVLGQQLATSLGAEPEIAEAPVETAASGKDGPAPDTGPVAPLILIPLEPVLTNLVEPADAWIRIEAQMVLTGEVEDIPALATRVSGDIAGHLRSLPLAAIEGATGLRYLTEDLNDLVRARSDGAVSEIVIHSLVIQ